MKEKKSHTRNHGWNPSAAVGCDTEKQSERDAWIVTCHPMHPSVGEMVILITETDAEENRFYRQINKMWNNFSYFTTISNKYRVPSFRLRR